MNKVGIGSDHGGFALKEELKRRLLQDGYEVMDKGVSNLEEVDYPDISALVAEGVRKKEYPQAILVCGTGIGVSMAANKLPGIRAALVSDVYSAGMARQHNDANIICLGGRTLGEELAYELVKAYLSEQFLRGKHQIRVDKITALESREA